MKKLFRILTAAVVAIAAVACQQNVLPESTPALVKHIKAYADNSAETKTALNGKVVEWEVDDVITVFDEDGIPLSSNELTEQDINSTVAEFTVNGLAEDAQVFAAIYPANKDAVLSDDLSVLTTFPSTQTAKNGSFGQNSNLAVATTEDDLSSLKFKNVGGLLALKVGGVNIADVTSIEISANEIMAGSVTVNPDNAEATKNSSDNADKTVTLEGSFEDNGTYYFSVLPGTYTGLKIIFKRPGFTATYSNPNSLTVARNSNTKIGEISISETKWVEDVPCEIYNFVSFTQDNDVELTAKNFNVTLHKNTGSTAPQWNGSSHEARVYAKGSVVVSSHKVIKKIVYNYTINANSKGKVPTVYGVAGAKVDGTWDPETKTWTGSDVTVTLSTSGEAGNLGFTSITVFFEDIELPAETYSVNIDNNIEHGSVSANPFSNVLPDTEVTLTVSPEDGYEFESWNVTNASTSAAITVTDNKFTMPAADVNVSATFVKIPTYLTTIDQIFDAATAAGSTATDTNVTFDNWVVSGVKGSNAYVTDNAGKGFIIYQSSHGFVTGDILSGSVACKVQLYNGSAELTSLTSTTTGLSVTKGGVVTPVSTIALASLSGVNTGAVLSYEGLEYNGTNFTDGATSLKPYNGLITLPTLISGKNYNVTGVYVQYRETKEIAPRTAEDFELVEVINKFVVTFDATENGTIVVKDGETVINDGDKVAEGTTLSVECTPANGYRFKNWQYKAGEAAWATRTTNPQSYIMPSANVQFRATFEVIPVYTIAWSVNGSIIKTENLEAGAAVETPNVDNPAGKEFRGWITSAIDGTTNEAPNFVTPSSTAIASVTYYAVFSSSAGEVTEELTNAEVDGLSSSSNLSYTKEKTYTDGTVEYSIYAYTDGNRKWMQLKKDKGSYVKMTAPMPIKRVELTITSTTNSSGGINDITKHTAYSGTVALCAADCAYTTSSISVASNSTITNNVATLNPSGDNTSLYLKVSTGARVWTISVTYGSYSYFTSF